MNRSRILIIEDEPTIADNLVYALETEGFLVDWVTTGRAGLAQVVGQAPPQGQGVPGESSDEIGNPGEGTPPDLVILDIGLPDMSGFDVCRAIRARCLIPILFLTARTDEVDQVVGLELGGDDYVVKPFSPRALTARVRALLRRCIAQPELPDAPGNGAAHTNGDFVIDTDARVVRLSGQDLGLTRYEYGLFKLMLEHPNRIYSREQLLQLVWEHPDECFDRTIDTHIKTLRAKIRQIDPRRDPIRTRRGEGYAYEP